MQLSIVDPVLKIVSHYGKNVVYPTQLARWGVKGLQSANSKFSSLHYDQFSPPTTRFWPTQAQAEHPWKKKTKLSTYLRGCGQITEIMKSASQADLCQLWRSCRSALLWKQTAENFSYCHLVCSKSTEGLLWANSCESGGQQQDNSSD